MKTIRDLSYISLIVIVTLTIGISESVHAATSSSDKKVNKIKSNDKNFKDVFDLKSDRASNNLNLKKLLHGYGNIPTMKETNKTGINTNAKNSDYSIESLNTVSISNNYSGFISTWITAFPGISASNQIALPLVSTGTYNFMVHWGDGNSDTITAWNQSTVTHTYSSSGIYTINITGTIQGWSFNNSGDNLKIINISHWGSLNLGNNGYYFAGASNLNITATDIPDLMGTTNFNFAFENCYNLGNTGILNEWNVSQVTTMAYTFFGDYILNQSIGSWDVSRVTNMSYMLSDASDFNQPIGSWNVSQVTDMSGMFSGALSFNQSLSGWVVSHVKDMHFMFMYDLNFNQSIGVWNVSSVTDTSYMFFEARNFNQPIGSWDVSSVTDMNGMFLFAFTFNQPLGGWNVSKVTRMGSMFSFALSFNQPIGSWDVSQVTDMSDMFQNDYFFNQAIGSWNVSKVRDTSYMFFNCHFFNQLLVGWNVSNVTKMTGMFSGSNFNQPIGSWDVSHVTDLSFMFSNDKYFNQYLNWDVSDVTSMSYMFSFASSFNQPLDGWNVSSVMSMDGMFFNATSFNQSLSNWNVSQVVSMYSMFDDASAFNQQLGSWNVSSLIDAHYMLIGTPLSTSNYDNLLIGWSSLHLRNNVIFNAGYATYSANAVQARNYIINTFSWTISDAGLFQLSSTTHTATSITTNYDTLNGSYSTKSRTLIPGFEIMMCFSVIFYLALQNRHKCKKN